MYQFPKLCKICSKIFVSWKLLIFLKICFCIKLKCTPSFGTESFRIYVLLSFEFLIIFFTKYNLWHSISKGSIWLKWSYCRGRVVRAISKHLRPIPSPTVENSLRNRHLNLKNVKSGNFKMLRNHNFNVFFSRKQPFPFHICVRFSKKVPLLRY